MSNAYKILVGKPEVRHHFADLGVDSHQCLGLWNDIVIHVRDNIKMYIKETWCEQNSNGSGHEPVAQLFHPSYVRTFY
jgi:hypothetical protein